MRRKGRGRCRGDGPIGRLACRANETQIAASEGDGIALTQAARRPAGIGDGVELADALTQGKITREGIQVGKANNRVCLGPSACVIIDRE